MKRALAILLALWLLMGNAAPAGAEPLTETDFQFVYEGAAYSLGGDPGALLRAMAARDGGQPELLETDSCLFSGKDKEFTGLELMLGTYPTGPGGKDALETVVITGGPWTTARGIGVGSAREEVIAAYGEGFFEDYDQMIYAVEEPYASPTLIFQLDLDSGLVIAIMLLAASA